MATEIEKVSSCVSSKFIWKIKKFSDVNARDGIYSRVFSVGKYKWKARIYPKGQGKVYDYLSLFIYPVELTKPVKTELRIAVTSQTHPSNIVKKESTCEFGSTSSSFGWPKFIRLSKLHETAKGYLVDDTCVIKVRVSCRLEEDSDDDDDDDDSEDDSEDDDNDSEDDDDSDVDEENHRDAASKVPEVKRCKIKDDRQ